MAWPVIERAEIDSCPLCFDANETPSILWAVVSDVKMGDAWSGPDGPAPNGIYQLVHDFDCNWVVTYGSDTVTFHTDGSLSRLRILRLGIGAVFNASDLNPCIFSMANGASTPVGNKFWDGRCALTWANPLESTSFLEVAELLQIPLDPSTFCNIVPFDSDEHIYRFRRKKDNTHIKIKFDFD